MFRSFFRRAYNKFNYFLSEPPDVRILFPIVGAYVGVKFGYIVYNKVS